MAAPRKTVTQALLDVRTNLDETTAAFWTDTRLIAFIDQAYSMVWSEVKKLKDLYFATSHGATDGTLTILGASYDSALLAIPIGTTPGSVTLPPDMDELHAVECITTDYEWVTFEFRPLNDPVVMSARRLTTGQPPGTFYVQVFAEKTLTYAPASSVALNLRITYTPILDTLTTGADTIQLPHPLYLAVIDYATSRAMMMDRAPEFMLWQQSAQGHIARFFGAHARQTQDAEYVTGTFE